MKKRRRRTAMDLYYDELFAEHGANMFCPLCDARPCCPGCMLGYETEDELLKLTEMLAEKDQKRKKRGQ